jgi:alpha-galactosidase
VSRSAFFSFPLGLRTALVAALASLPLGLLAPAATAGSMHPSSGATRAGSAAVGAGPAASRPASTSPAPAPVTPNGLAATPPMGWNDWYSFTCNVNEQLVEQSAKAMVTSGMKAVGYQYVNIDDCWLAKQRDANGNLQADPAKFPDGIKAVADYVHSLGLKLGIYEDSGTATCAGYPGSYGHYQQDADTFASWGIDFVKLDWCNVPFGDFPGMTHQQVAQTLYTQFSQALQATGRPMVFSVCEWDPSLKPWTWAPAIANMWRSNNDYGDTWNQVLANLDQEASLAPDAGPGHWNDPDILQVGRGGMTTAEDQAHFSMWSMLSAPLLAGNDLRTMSAATQAILTNREVIAIDQDPLGAEATRLSQNGNADVWVKRLANGDRAVMLLNRGGTPLNISTTAQAAGLPNAGAYAARDLWAHTTRESAGTIAASVPPDSAMLYRVSPLNGEVDQYAPVTDVSVTPQVPAAYPGSQFQVAQPGQTITVPASLRNDSRAAVTNASLSLAAPSGWTVSGATASAGAVPTGKQLGGSWQVTVPPGTAPGSYALTGNATYQWGDGTHSASNSGQGSFQVVVPPAGTPYLDQLSWLSATSSFDGVLVDKSYFGTPLTIHGTQYPHGLWANSIATIYYYLGGNCSTFTTDLGLDDSTKATGAVDYQFYSDGTKVYDSGVVTNSTPTVHAQVNVTGTHILELYVGEGNGTINYGNADFGNPQLTCNS